MSKCYETNFILELLSLEYSCHRACCKNLLLAYSISKKKQILKKITNVMILATKLSKFLPKRILFHIEFCTRPTPLIHIIILIIKAKLYSKPFEIISA
jgi:hypothetical protein